VSAASAWLLVAAAALLMPGRRGGGQARRGEGRGGAAPARPARWRRRPPDPAVPLVLDLAAAVLRGGRPLSDALELAAPAARPDTAATLTRVARLLRLGADPEQAWADVPADHAIRPLAPVAIRSAASGAKLAAAFERLAVELRAERSANAAARAQRAGVFALAPLAACFLPSFVCLGVVPTVVGIAGTALGRGP
jgi:Flp pilus assembly protein TadB